MDDEATPTSWTPMRTWSLAHVLYVYVAQLAALAAEAAALGSPEAFGELFPGLAAGIAAGIGAELSGNEFRMPRAWAVGLMSAVSIALGVFVGRAANASWSTSVVAAVLATLVFFVLVASTRPSFRRGRNAALARWRSASDD